MDKAQFLQIFKSEAETYLTKLDQGLVALEKDPHQKPLLEELFRAAHTLKGNASMMGYKSMSEVAHRIEDLFGEFQKGEKELDSNLASQIFKAVDAMKKALANIAKGEEEGIDVEKIKQMLSGEAVESSKEEVPVEEPEERVSKPVASEEVQDEVENQVEEKVEEKVEKKAVESAPEPVKKTKVEEVQEVVEDKELEDEKQTQDYSESEEDEMIRVPLSRINNLLNLTGEIVVNRVKSGYKIDLFKKLSKQIISAERMLNELKSLTKEALGVSDEIVQHGGKFLRGSRELEKAAPVFNQLHNMELIFSAVKEDTVQLADDVQSEAFHLNPVIEELQQKMKEIRMLPCQAIFEGFPRIVRDIAQEQEKKVNLIVHGEQTELDKKVLEAIKGPMIHILRNALDHGIESPNDRSTQGKPETATITINAYQEGGKVVITVEDDGAGINVEKVKEIALRKGIVFEEDLGEMTDVEIMGLIFSPGFSTAPMITDVSGRGVGLDVVKTELDQLKGTVSVNSELNQGTTFRLELPLTIAILQVLLVRAAGASWAFPITSLQENIRVTSENISTIQNKMMIQLRGRSVPLMDLNEILGIKHDGESDKSDVKEGFQVLIVQSLSRPFGLIVEKVIGEDEVFIKNLGAHLGKVKGVSGAAVLASGECIVILDPQALVKASQTKTSSGHVRKRRGTKVRKRILLVEDSLTTRELEKTILENGGYEVETAIDGLNAVEKLAEGVFDAIVSDIKMPRMDGFEFCHHVKTNDKYKDIPFVFVSSLAKEEEKRKGMDVGGQAYIVKSQFDQGNLLDTLERLMA